jgi:hypothetical protein
MMAAWSREMMTDLDGPNLSAMELEAFNVLRQRKLILDSVAGYLVERLGGNGLVIRRRKTLMPIVKEWSSLADAYMRDLQVLGLKRRARETPSLGVIAREYADGNGGHETNEVNEISPEAKP